MGAVRYIAVASAAYFAGGMAFVAVGKSLESQWAQSLVVVPMGVYLLILGPMMWGRIFDAQLRFDEWLTFERRRCMGLARFLIEERRNGFKR